MTHFQRYASVYLYAVIFTLVTVCSAFVGEFSNMTAAQETAMTRLQWAVSFSSVIVSAGTTLMALLNKSFSQAQAQAQPQPSAAVKP